VQSWLWSLLHSRPTVDNVTDCATEAQRIIKLMQSGYALSVARFFSENLLIIPVNTLTENLQLSRQSQRYGVQVDQSQGYYLSSRIKRIGTFGIGSCVS